MRRGFTLIELLLVVAIIALIGSVGSGMYVNSYKAMLVEKAAKQFLMTAKYARIAAIEQGKPYDLLMDATHGKFFLATMRTNDETGQPERAIVRDYYCKPVALQGDVKFEKVEVTTMLDSSSSDAAEERRITFLPTGSTESAIVQLGDGTTHYTVALVAATGRATLYDGPAEKVKTAVIDLDLER